MTDEPRVAQKFPYVLNLKPGTYKWCTCGRSAKQPFCDDSHIGTGFTPYEFTLERQATVVLCGCKRTADRPFCDGSHANL